jgi:aspartate/methionine/tyrosine aminotransferase
MPPEVLREVGQMAQRAGAFVLVDEVYLDATCDQTPRTAFLLGDEFIVTNSLTKVYGLSGLRCGWVLAKPELVERMWRLKDLFGVNEAHPAERLSVVAFSRLAEIRARMLALLDQNRLVFEDFLAGRDDLEVSCPPCGTVAFPRVRAGRVDELCELLRAEYATSVVPGRFFEMDDHIRIGLCASTGTLTAGLERLGAALDRHRA